MSEPGTRLNAAASDVLAALSARAVTTRSGRFSVLLLVACASLGHTDLAAQAIDGILLDREQNQPIGLGIVMLLTVDGDSVASVLSDEEGRFLVESPRAGEFLLSASALGYKPTIAASVFTLTEGGRTSLEFRIQPLAIEIGGLRVDVRASQSRESKLVRNGFVERAQRGFGRFITPADIERANPLSTAELLTRTGRVTTQYALGGARILMRGPVGYCPPSVYLDGVPISATGMSLDAIAPVSELDAAEVYRSGAEAPLRYRGETGGTRGCGIIVLWTRAR